jgi:hypothetical protein
MKLYELINPSDPYTFYAPNIEIAGVAAALLSTGFGAKPVDGEGESSPVLFGWGEWMKDKGIDSKWIELHSNEIAAALDTFLIGGAAARGDVEKMLEMLPEEKRQEWKESRQDRHRSSMTQIGETAYKLAATLRPKTND